LAAQDAIRHDMESAIGDFFVTQLPKRLRLAAAEAAAYLGAEVQEAVVGVRAGWRAVTRAGAARGCSGRHRRS
jgi:hypothetical protein